MDKHNGVTTTPIIAVDHDGKHHHDQMERVYNNDFNDSKKVVFYVCTRRAVFHVWFMNLARSSSTSVLGGASSTAVLAGTETLVLAGRMAG